jgi:nucleoside-diphosphate-sugar epimerase
MITVLGASGFIGRHFVQRLQALGIEYYEPDRNADLSDRNLGDVIYCIGLTADFRSRPFDTVDAHVCKLREVLQECQFDSLLYLSSTRGYRSEVEPVRQVEPVKENSPLQIAPLEPGDLHNISKAMGESLVLNCEKRTRVARLSNVYGGDFFSDNFLATVIRDAITKKKVVLETSAGSEKDYVSVDDVVGGLIDIATRGCQRIYNLASGVNVSNGELLESLMSLTGCAVEFSPEAREVSYPRISIERMQDEFNFTPSSVLNDLPHLVGLYQDYEGTAEGGLLKPRY